MVPDRVIERVMARVERAGECIVSTYSTGSHGYAQVGWHADGRVMMTLCHRVAWEAAYGPIPGGLTVDHICRNRRCINVDHLRLLTNEANGRANAQSLLTHCLRGHPFDEANTYVRANGHRICRACSRERRAA